MADIEHKNIPDAGRHEPKGASTAAAGSVYVSDGAGSGSWTDLTKYYTLSAEVDASTTKYVVASLAGDIKILGGTPTVLLAVGSVTSLSPTPPKGGIPCENDREPSVTFTPLI